jgi:hypothetical protein
VLNVIAPSGAACQCDLNCKNERTIGAESVLKDERGQLLGERSGKDGDPCNKLKLIEAYQADCGALNRSTRRGDFRHLSSVHRVPATERRNHSKEAKKLEFLVQY